MQINVALLPTLVGNVENTVCIVIDVLRATSVLAVVFERGLERAYIATSHEIARRYAREQGYLLCGETDGLRVPDFDYGNSPVEFSTLDLAGKRLVLSTSNGTKAAGAVQSAQQVFFGAARNRASVANAAWESASQLGADISIVCAGTKGQFSLEDATVAGMYVEALVSNGEAWTMPTITDSAIAARRLWQTEPNLLRGWMEGNHAIALCESGFGEDVGYCSAIDVSETVPILVSQNDTETAATVVLVG